MTRASSNPGDMVLDPFCGCATACVAAETEGRQWTGIDACDAAEDIARVRLSETVVDFTNSALKVSRTPPRRLKAKPPGRAPRRERIADGIKDRLHGAQHGDCNGCGHHCRIKDMDIDHIHPVALGGEGDVANLQLLCSHCKQREGDRHDG